jgi:hypothetical protein
MNIKLPSNIDYSKYTSESGMATSQWGGKAWDFLFTSIIGRYPIIINETNPQHLLIKLKFKNMLTGLKDTLPCIYCRNSYKDFIKELPIEPHLIGRIELMYWLYLIKDKVNIKLINQEKICYLDEKKRLKELFYNKKISENDYYIKINNFKQFTFKTIPTPPFEQVLDKYEMFRAECSQKSLSCVLPNPLK